MYSRSQENKFRSVVSKRKVLTLANTNYVTATDYCLCDFGRQLGGIRPVARALPVRRRRAGRQHFPSEYKRDASRRGTGREQLWLALPIHGRWRVVGAS